MQLNLKDKFKNMKMSRKIILFVLLFFYVALTLSSIVRVNYTLTTPGAITKATNFVEVKDEETFDSGMIYGTSVFSYDRISAMKYVLAHLSKKSKIEKYNSKEELSKAEDALSGKIYRETSSIDAIIAAFTEASKVNENIKISYSFEGMQVVYVNHLYSKSDLQVGDIIISLGGKTLTSTEDYKDVGLSLAHDGVWDAIIKRDNEEIPMQLDLYEEDSKFYRSFSAVAKHVINEDETYPKFEIKDSSISGPSAGLMQSLSIYNSLIEEDVTKGKVIAGTGTINILKDKTNSAGAIGSIEQKIYTASLVKNLDYFFVDKNDYEEAKITYDKLDNPSFMLVSASSLNDVLSFLKEVKDE